MIGIFDSGCGGLTVLRAIRNRLPSVDIVYFGDTKHAPYGGKSREELSLRTIEAIQLLQSRGATSIVSACNSVSASLAISLFDTLSFSPDRLIEMVGPTASAFRDSDARILLCATAATVDSEIYQNAFHMLGKDIKTVVIPELAGAIERSAPPQEIEDSIRTAFTAVDTGAFDVLVLACTHYPLVADVFRRVLGDVIAIVDPAEYVAERVERKFWPREVGDGKTTFLLSAESTPFRSFVSEFFPAEVSTIEVIQ